jgi:hypothetical protein
MRCVILHYHIFKNAGSTVEDILANTFYERLGRYDSADYDHVIGNDEIVAYLERDPNLQAFSSHQIRYPMPEIPGYLFFDWCVLRDPIERLRSTYRYFRKKPAMGEPSSDLANLVPPGEWVARMVRDYPYRINNVQVNMLANGNNDDPPSEADLARASERMRSIAMLGVVDCFNQSLIAGQYFLRPVFPALAIGQQPANVSGGKNIQFAEACDPEVYAELLRLNALDTRLLELARIEVHRRFALVPDGAARLAALEQRT